MVNLTDPHFGEPIKFKNTQRPKQNQTIKGQKVNQMGGDAMVSQFITIKKNYAERLGQMAGSDHHARRFFCKDDCAFIFDYKVLLTLVKAIEAAAHAHKDKRMGGVFLFQGVKRARPGDKKSQDRPGEPPTSQCSFGRPTIIAAAYRALEDGSFEHIRIPKKLLKEHAPEFANLVDDDADGFQHPGNGNSGDPQPVSGTGDASINFKPKVVDFGDDDNDTDYVIKTVIGEETLRSWFDEE